MTETIIISLPEGSLEIIIPTETPEDIYEEMDNEQTEKAEQTE